MPAAAPHYGKTVIVATDQDLADIRAGGYTDGVNHILKPQSAVVVAAKAVTKAHTIDNFINDPTTGRRSVLEDGQAFNNARNHSVMISAYRRGLSNTRAALAATVQGGSFIFDPATPARNILNSVKPDRPAGEPAKKGLKVLTQDDFFNYLHNQNQSSLAQSAPSPSVERQRAAGLEAQPSTDGPALA